MGGGGCMHAPISASRAPRAIVYAVCMCTIVYDLACTCGCELIIKLVMAWFFPPISLWPQIIKENLHQHLLVKSHNIMDIPLQV
jgi:hypothetical protein